MEGRALVSPHGCCECVGEEVRGFVGMCVSVWGREYVGEFVGM